MISKIAVQQAFFLIFDPTGGTHFAHNLAGHDLSLAMLVTCTPALAIAGSVGIIGARWMKVDLAAAAEADRLAHQADPISTLAYRGKIAI